MDNQSEQSNQVEKRNSRRFEYPHPIYLTPLDASGKSLLEETFGVLGRHLSEAGLDFYHKEPIAAKFVIASFEYSPSRWAAARVELRWCRFARHGYFENGGVFCEMVDSPIGAGQLDN